MATKKFETDNIGTITVTKRRGTHNLRVSIGANGQVRVSIPAWASFQSGIDFARSQTDWILQHSPDPAADLHSGHRIGKAHRLVFVSADVIAPSSRIAGGEIRVSKPADIGITHPTVQDAARRASIRALRLQAEALLPQRLRSLAATHSFSFTDVSVRQLKGRWGSCDSNRHIVLNLFLMQLPWELIDYVLLHELVHTRHMNHGNEFWREFLACEPRARLLRKSIKRHRPVLEPVDPAAVMS